MLTIQQIISEVDTLVPNPFDNAKKITWINELNREFFEIVKIPMVHIFTFTPGIAVTLPTDVRSRSISRVQLGNTFFLSLQYEQVIPGHNNWILDDVTKELTLNPKPTTSQEGSITYHKISSKTFLLSGIADDSPEAPEEYHWAYVLGLAEHTAKAMNDVTLANNYGNDYKGLLLLAQQNYARQSNGE